PLEDRRHGPPAEGDRGARGRSRRHLWHSSTVDDAVARYRAASESDDIDGLMETLAPDVELVSPLSGRMVFRGKDDLRDLLAAIYGTLSGLHWDEEVGDGSTPVVIGEARVGPVRIGDAMGFDLA